MTQYDNEISLAEMIMRNNTDSALSLLDEIDPSELEIDSLRAKYHYLKGWGHLSGKPFHGWRFPYRICPQFLSR